MILKGVNEMPCIRIPNGIICMPSLFTVEYNGRTYCFENHSYFGLLPCKKDGDGTKKDHPKGAYEAAKVYLKSLKEKSDAKQ